MRQVAKSRSLELLPVNFRAKSSRTSVRAPQFRLARVGVMLEVYFTRLQFPVSLWSSLTSVLDALALKHWKTAREHALRLYPGFCGTAFDFRTVVDIRYTLAQIRADQVKNSHLQTSNEYDEHGQFIAWSCCITSLGSLLHTIRAG